MGDRDYFLPTDTVERRVTLSRILMFTLIIVNGATILWESTLLRSSWLGGALHSYLLLFPHDFVHRLRLWQPLTYWLFEGSVWQLLFDAVYLWWLGSMVEDFLGKRKFAVLWAGGILLPAILFVALGYVLFPLQGYFGPGGALLALMVVAALQWPDMGVIFIFIPMRLKWLAVIYVAANIGLGLESIGPSYWATLVGALWGFLFWRYHARVGHALARWDEIAERRAEVKRNASERQESAEVDRILEKIAKDGMPSLTSAERKLLDRASRNRRER